MKLTNLRLSGFRSFGLSPVTVGLDGLTFLLGPNGAGKTAVLQALARMFSLDPNLRRIKSSDFHIPSDEVAGAPPESRELWLEADFQFPELETDDAEDDELPAVPGNFAHMQLVAKDGPARMRFRLKATIDLDGDIEETFTCVIREDEEGVPVEESRVSKQDRNSIQVHYIPARRNPADHISYSANALLGRALRAADWTAERDDIRDLTGQIEGSLKSNGAIESIGESLAKKWAALHKGAYYASPSVSFAASEIENLLKHLSVGFSPGHGESLVDFSRLSDGQQSLLYISLVLAMHDIGSEVLSGNLDAFNIDKLRPAIFTLIAVEEPENSLSPHYLGRVIKAMTAFSEDDSAQALIATHSPSLLRRVPPESIRYFRLNDDRTTSVRLIVLPEGEVAHKYVREGIQAFPELYFSRLVVLGEGDSEEIVLPRLMAARGILTDDASVSVVPLGGRHVNHFWRLLNALDIPYVTLLDLDVARHQGGWGRIRYAAKNLLAYANIEPNDLTNEDIDSIPVWNSDHGIMVNDEGWIERLEKLGVFFSTPLDLDFMMLMAYPDAYKVEDDQLVEPDEAMLKAVLGKNHDIVGGQYKDGQLEYFDSYHSRFKIGSKPTWHIRAIAELDDDELLETLPQVLDRMFDSIEGKLEDLPE
ncbi:ATP-dependent nuclease [Oxalicibacterium solurbis]|uniref:Chromosome segregation protein SMC n=1 Tax=Oxalicibacterium solurbis TaxID=69280 RepID=A0A8J3B1Q2_9BURK|nr:AAA family ATPase [Oxalicibacterium solurbis]GGI53234.1 chromosome segregation protein SMC [Oxalicibacterium solurbis]